MQHGITFKAYQKQAQELGGFARSMASHTNNVKAAMDGEQGKLINESDKNLGMIIEKIKSVNELSLLTTSPARKIRILKETASAELITKRAKIFAEAKEERNSEQFTLKKIQFLGEEAKKSVLKFVEVVFSQITTERNTIPQ